MRNIIVVFAVTLAFARMAHAYDHQYLKTPDYEYCDQKADNAGFFADKHGIKVKCLEQRDAQNKKAAEAQEKSQEKAFAEAQEKLRQRQLQLQKKYEKIRQEREKKEAEREAKQKAERQKRIKRAEEYEAKQRAKAEAERQERERKEAAAEKVKEAKIKALKAECGKDYHKVRVGMTLKRVEHCTGKFTLSSQLNRSDGVASVYRHCAKYGYSCGYLVVMDGKIIAWQAP